MSLHGHGPPLSPRCNAGDVVDELRRLDFRQLHRHIADAIKDRFERKRRIEDQIGMGVIREGSNRRLTRTCCRSCRTPPRLSSLMETPNSVSKEIVADAKLAFAESQICIAKQRRRRSPPGTRCSAKRTA
jgi:hypothetical protein